MYRLESRRALPSQAGPPQPVGFVNARCPKCHRVTSYLNFQITARITCTWTNCAYTWCESADRRVADRDRSDFRR
jgi:hypothetical protein